MAQVLHDEGVLCEPDSREPWFVSAAHDASCLSDTLKAFRDRRRRDAQVGRRHPQSHRLSAVRWPRASLSTRSSSAPGHNGLVAACYLARAGLKVQVLERMPFIGGAAVSRRLYKDFTYSNCSYVCSLLRPEIMRTLELPKYGLQVIPYEGGCTMMQGGGHLALYDNHDALRREISRHSKRDAEAYDRYARDVMRQCKFIKPLLHARAARSDLVQAARYQGAAVSRPALPRPRRGAHVRYAALLDHERRGFSRRVFRERDRQGAFCRQLHHRHGARAPLAGHRLRAAASLHGRHRRHGRRMGIRARRHGCDQQGARQVLRGERRPDPQRRAGERKCWSRAAAPREWCSRTARRSTLRWWSPISTCAAPS